MEKNYNDQIDQYLRGELSSEDESAFLAEVNSSAELKSELELAQDIQKGIELDALYSAKSLLAAEEVKLKKPEAPSSSSNNWWWKAAASLVLICSVLYFFLGQSADMQELYSQSYSPYPNIVNPVNRSSSDQPKDWPEAYEAKKYAQVINVLDEKLKADPDSDVYLFYLAQSHLALGSADEAITHLEKIKSDSKFYEPAQWYVALSYLKQDNSDKAEEKLNQIKDSDSAYAMRAEKLLNSL
ncbi:tetratricopeptide repeat protein [Fulvivirga ligni]|uniref:tetratricopeptide repeat protein n=1 Tax=Fulvivirga ligni TaxID=2904246 RepID=UPI001F417CBD|nr:tetratricopeptide repeat protein [Fulvivirga ligni]UII22598.1 tetratricopeptide repeat protein [Fulvivirga ligni]